MTDSALFSEQRSLQLPGIALATGVQRVDADGLNTMLSALPSTDQGVICNLPEACLGHHAGNSCQDGDVAVACVGSPYWLGEAGKAAEVTEIAAAYRAQGEKFLESLGGPFALAILDKGGNELLCAVDRFAREQLYWRGDEDGVVVASSTDAALAHPASDRQLSQQGLFHYVFFHMVPGPDSIYEDIHKLPAAHLMHWREGQLQIRSYWTPAFTETLGDEQHLLEGVLDTLRAAVARNSSGDDCGAFLSGGLDSSTVAGLLAGIQPGADSYSIGFDAKGYDEIAFARIASNHFGTKPHEYYLTPEDVLGALPSIAAAYDEPFGNSSALPTLFCARLARQDGKHSLLAGDGGDELYAGNARYAKQKVFELYQGLPAVLQRVLGMLAWMTPEQLPVLRKFKSYVNQAAVPLPDRLQTYNHLVRQGLNTVFTEAFIDGIDAERPHRLEREIYQRPQDASTLNRMLYLDWHHTLADNDLRKVGRMCRLADIEVRYPMLDEAVIAHSTQVPSELKLPGGKLRDFYKRAVTGFLPAQILDKPKHGFGLPFGVWMVEHPGLQEIAGDSLSRLRRRGIFKPSFIDRIMLLHQQSHAAYYGELVWVMMMLELWLSSHGFEP